MKLIIQIPCYNEESTLGVTLENLPREIPGIDVVEWMVIDDGSTDRTSEIAREYGVDHLIRLSRNKGLARAFMAGIEACLLEGADIIVNTDGDNQYSGEDIPGLIGPILSGEAELVIGAREINEIEHFSHTKKILQRVGSYIVRLASNTNVPDAPSGFRAFSKEAAMSLNVFNNYTYTLETIIQAGRKGLAVTSVPVRTNEKLRPSRLFKSIPGYIFRSTLTIIRIFMTYRPFRFFALLGSVIFLLGTFVGIRFLHFYFSGSGGGHVQSLILASILIGAGCLLFVAGLLSDLIAVNRVLLEKNQLRLKKMEEKIRNSASDPS